MSKRSWLSTYATTLFLLAAVVGFSTPAKTATIGFDPSVLDFGSVAIGNTSGGLSSTVTVSLGSGQSLASLTFSFLSNPSNVFAVVQNTCPGSSSSSFTCGVEIDFSPASLGIANGTYGANYSFSDISGGSTVVTLGRVLLSVTGIGSAATTAPLPAALPLFATGLGALGLFGWRRKRKAQATA
jgi:hypothetical protein